MIKWKCYNDSPAWFRPRRNIWFLSHYMHGERQYLLDRRGRLRTFATYEKASLCMGRLNKIEEEKGE